MLYKSSYHQTSTIVFFLSEKPVIKIKSSQPSSVIEGSTLYLDCVATGFPRPRVTWVRIRDGQVLQNRTNDEATSLVRNFTKCDEGEYRCTAKNRLGSDNYTLQVIVIGEFLLSRSEMKGTLYIYIFIQFVSGRYSINPAT